AAGIRHLEHGALALELRSDLDESAAIGRGERVAEKVEQDLPKRLGISDDVTSLALARPADRNAALRRDGAEQGADVRRQVREIETTRSAARRRCEGE